VTHAGTNRHLTTTLAALMLATIAYAMQQTMVVPALPEIQRDLHTTTTWATWIFTGLLLTSSVLTPILGKLGDQYGKERLLAISLGLFMLGSIGSSLAWDIWSLIAWRGVQGAGAAVIPLAFAIINDEFPRDRAGGAIGLISAALATGAGFGLPLSGVITDNFSWRILFVVGAIVGLAALVLVVAVVPESPIKTPSSIDYAGATILTVILVAFLVGLSEGGNWGWTSPAVLGLLALSAILIPVWIRVELHQREPLVDVRMLAIRPVAVANMTAILAGFSMYAAFVAIPQFVQAGSNLPAALQDVLPYGFAGSATEAGLVLLPGALMGLVIGPLAGRMGMRYGFIVPNVVGMVVAAIGLAMLATFHDEVWQVVVGMIVTGAGIPFTFAAMAKLVVDAVRPQETAVATGMNTVMRTIGGVIGGQILAVFLTSDTIGNTGLPAESAYTTMFWLCSAAAGLAAVLGVVFLGPGRRRATAPRTAEPVAAGVAE
jgi:EmrB/QacA subfamily drug resistance transporter